MRWIVGQLRYRRRPLIGILFHFYDIWYTSVWIECDWWWLNDGLLLANESWHERTSKLFCHSAWHGCIMPYIWCLYNWKAKMRSHYTRHSLEFKSNAEKFDTRRCAHSLLPHQIVQFVFINLVTRVYWIWIRFRMSCFVFVFGWDR